jgi:hypothetical protein
MAIVVGKSQGGYDRTPAPAGSHVATFIKMVDIGTQPNEWQGVSKPQRIVKFCFELPYELMECEGRQVPQTIWKDFNMTMGGSTKSNLRAFLEEARGKSYTEEEAKNVLIGKVLGHSVQISVVHEISKSSGKTYDKIKSVMPLAKGMQKPNIHHALVEFAIDDLKTENHDKAMAAFESLPQGIKEKIQASPEWQKVMGVQAPAQAAPVASYQTSGVQPSAPQAPAQPQGKEVERKARDMSQDEISVLVGGDEFLRKQDNVLLTINSLTATHVSFTLLGKPYGITHSEFSLKILPKYWYLIPEGDDFDNTLDAPDDDLPF